jgi:hypothetical protein
MARTPLGARPQPHTRTALFSYIAARLSGVPATGFDNFFETLGVAVRSDGAQRAARRVRHQPALKRRAGRATADRDTPTPAEQVAFREWLLIDERRLDLELALVTFPGDGRHQGGLIRALAGTAGVRQVIETAHKRDVIAIVVFSGPEQRRELQASLEELAERRIWDDILFETHEPAINTWRALSRRAAEEEDLAARG